MIPNLLGVAAIGGHFWTLEVELLFYVIVGMLFVAFGSLRIMVVIPAYLLVVVSCLSWDRPPEVEGYWLRLPLFFSIMFYGACCREIVKNEGVFGRQKYHFHRVITLGAITGLVSIWPLQGAYFGFIENDFYQIKAAFVMLTAILGFLFWAVFIRVKIGWLARAGRWTYSVYLFHWLVLYSLLSKITTYMSGWPLPVYITLVLGVSFGIGAMAYRWIEQLSDRIGKRIVGD